MSVISNLTKFASIISLVIGLLAFLTPYWLQISLPFRATYGVNFFVVTRGSTFIVSTYPIETLLVVDIFFVGGFVYLIVSIVRFFQAQKYFNIKSTSSNQAKKLHRQSLSNLMATNILYLVAMIVMASASQVKKSSFQQLHSTLSLASGMKSQYESGFIDSFGSNSDSVEENGDPFGSDPFARAKRSIGNSLSSSLADLVAYFGVSFYLGWLSLLFSSLAFVFNALAYKRAFLDHNHEDCKILIQTIS